jgi:hypothetical protein
MPIQHVYQFAIGPAVDDCVMLGVRYDPDFGIDPAQVEQAIIELVPGESEDDDVTMHVRWRVKALLTGIWRSPSRTVYVADSNDPAIWRFRDLAQRQEVLSLPKVYPEGVFGLDDEHVYVWGSRKRGEDHEFPFLRWDGRQWIELPMPGYRIVSMHGLAPDLLYAVGRDGFVGRFDGSAWKRFPVPTEEILRSVHVVGRDEIYACGYNGTVLEGSASGWGRIAENYIDQAPLLSVAKFKGQLYLAGGPQGVLRRVRNTDRIEVVKDNILATWFDATADHLLITCDEEICGTNDGKNWVSVAEGYYADVVGNQPLMMYK